MLKITLENAMVGNRAMASVLLLYYHLMREGGITNEQTVYIASEDFNASEFVDVEVEDGLEIDQKLIREGACLSLLCDLNDWIGEYEADYLRQPVVIELLKSLGSRGEETVPELGELLASLSRGEENRDPHSYKIGLKMLFEKYVAARWLSIGMAGKA